METKEQYHLELVSIWKSIVVFLSPMILAIFFFSLANWFQLIDQSKNLDNVIRAVMLIIYIMLAINWRKLTPTYTRIIELGTDSLEVQDSNEKILLDKINGFEWTSIVQLLLEFQLELRKDCSHYICMFKGQHKNHPSIKLIMSAWICSIDI